MQDCSNSVNGTLVLSHQYDLLISKEYYMHQGTGSSWFQMMSLWLVACVCFQLVPANKFLWNLCQSMKASSYKNAWQNVISKMLIILCRHRCADIRFSGTTFWLLCVWLQQSPSSLDTSLNSLKQRNQAAEWRVMAAEERANSAQNALNLKMRDYARLQGDMSHQTKVGGRLAMMMSWYGNALLISGPL